MQPLRVGKGLLLILLSLCFAIPLFSQTQTGSLTGTVTQEDAGLPGVRVTVSSPTLQGTRTVETDVNGKYNLSALPPGHYQVTFEMEGMQSINKTVDVTLSGVSRADAAMKLSSVAEAITVTAAAPSVVESSQIQTNLDKELIENLPVARTLLGTVSLAPGTNTNGPAGATAISGAPSFDSTWYVNGTPVNEVLRGQPLDVFIEDALQETTVLTGAISAEYGRFTGGVVNAISKSGGNEFSGSIRDSLTNPSWAESTPQNEELLDKTNNQYEATLGGRIIRDRLWFFGAGRMVSRSTQDFLVDSTDSFNTKSDQKRLEGKLTGQITPKHSLIGSFLKLSASIENRCLPGLGTCWDLQSLSQKEDQPQDLYSGTYNGIFTNNLLMEAFWSRSSLKFSGSGGLQGSPVDATPVYFVALGQWAGPSEFCADCGTEVRKSDTWGLKPTYYLSTTSMGTHNIVGGYEEFSNSLFSNNHQSGSDFWIYNLDPRQARNADGSVTPRMGRDVGLLVYWTILQDAQPNKLATKSVFVNDKWDLNNRLSFNLGGRYDKNDGKNEAGFKVADDSKFSPRLGLTYDAFGNGRLRFNASYSEYVSQIANGNIADASSPAGSPSLLYWLYDGPSLQGLSTKDFTAAVFNWFNSVGGTSNRDLLLGGGTNGIGTQIPNSLRSPAVREIAFGVGSQVGRNGYARFDFQDRKWNDFYVTEVNLGTGTVFDPLVGADLDRGILTNSDDLTRKYKAMIFQGGYRVSSRLNLAANYTWSKLEGNTVAETSGSGPISDAGPGYYPEVFGFANNNPVGLLAADQRHKVRAWATYDLPTRLGNFDFSVLQRFDSGTPYSVVGSVDPIAWGVANPGYLNVEGASSGGVNYFFGKRGSQHWDDLTATDLGINYALPISKLNVFFQGEILNVLNGHAQLAGDTSVSTAFDDGSLEPFNPFTDTPVEGVNFVKGANFGEARTPLDYQLPRTYRFSVGLKF